MLRCVLIVCAALALAASASPAAAGAFVLYYADAPVPGLFEHELVVLDSHAHPPLPARPTRAPGQRILGYLSLGEIDAARRYAAEAQKRGLLLAANPNWPGARYVDIRNPRWKAMVLDRLVPEILAAGFDGLFLDTLDSPPWLEAVDAKANRGMRAAAIDLVRAIRKRWPGVPIMMNRGYALLPELTDAVDMILAESLRADHDFETKTYRRVPPELVAEQMQILTAARVRRPGLKLYALDYWDPADPAGIASLYAEERAAGLEPYVATVALDQVIPEPR